MRGTRLALAVAACAALAAPAAGLGATQSALAIPGRALAVGDFETGGLTQWSVAARKRASSIQVVRSPVRQGRYAARFEVRRGDNPIGFGDRAQIQINTGEREGQVRWYSWSTRVARDFPRYGAWQVLAQWHAGIPAGQVPDLGTTLRIAGDAGASYAVVSPARTFDSTQ